MITSRRKKSHRPTLGFLSGWQLYERTILADYYGELAQGILRTAQEHQCNVLLACGMSPSGFPIVVRPALPIHDPNVDYVPAGEWNTDGLILAYPLIGKPVLDYVEKLRAANFPIVTIGGADAVSSVQIDNDAGIQQAMTHLLEHGHESIAFIGGHTDDVAGDSGQRLRAYQAFVRQHGLSRHPALVEMGDYAFDGGLQAMKKILQTGVPFSAVLASGDKAAIGAIDALKAAGLNVPDDVAVIAFDDTSDAVLHQPPISAIGFSAFELGRQAAELLLRRLQNPDEPLPSVKVKPRLFIRQSCGCQSERERRAVLPPALSRPPAPLDPRLLADEMSCAVLPFVLRLKEDEVLALCDRLALGISRALQTQSPVPFRTALKDTLTFVASIQDDVYAWRWAMVRLYQLFQAGSLGEENNRLMEFLISEGRETIAEAIQRQRREYLENQRRRADQMGLLSARLLTALDEQQVYDILAEQLAEMGVRHLALAFFHENLEGLPERADFQVVLGERKLARRLQPQEFPPKGAYREPFSLALLPLGGEAGVSGYAVFDTGHLESYGAITQQIKVALRLAQLYQGALDGLKAAEEAGQMKSRFLSTVSHELQTPLRVIVTDSERLMNEGMDSPSLQRIYGSARHLDALIRDVLDLNRTEIGQLKLTCESLDLNAALQPVFAIGKQLAADKGLAWTLHAPPHLPAVWGDAARLRQVTLNLLTNAVKFTAQGEIEVNLTARAADVLVSVRDTGVGVPLEEQKMIFGEYYQSSRTQEQRAAGMGIGLALCKRLVEMHGGEIGVRSDPQRGSTFFFSVPILGAEDAPSLGWGQGSDVESVPRAREASSPKVSSILLVDDEPLLLQMHAQLIREQIPFAKITTAENGANALEQMRRNPPDLVMLDLGMPGMDGFRVLEEMRAQETTRAIPVIILTGQSLSEADMARLRGRVEAVLHKGLLRTDEVLAQLRKALSRSQEALSGDMRALMRKAMGYIQEHFDEPLSREDVARHVGVSAGYFSRSFPKEAGISFQEYLNRYRIHRARALLEDGRLSVTDVAFSVGFQNVSYFCQVFRQVTGVSPRGYQKGRRVDR